LNVEWQREEAGIGECIEKLEKDVQALINKIKSDKATSARLVLAS
jgi:hypothetical protein